MNGWFIVAQQTGLLVILTATIELAPVVCLLMRSLGTGMWAIKNSHRRFLLPALHARGESPCCITPFFFYN